MGTGRIEISTLDLEEGCFWHSERESNMQSGKILECRGGEVWDYNRYPVVKTDEVCPRCKGRGMHPTSLGWEILEFVQSYAGWER